MVFHASEYHHKESTVCVYIERDGAGGIFKILIICIFSMVVSCTLRAAVLNLNNFIMPYCFEN